MSAIETTVVTRTGVKGRKCGKCPKLRDKKLKERQKFILATNN